MSKKFRSTNRDYDNPLYKKFRAEVRARDRHQCQMPSCGSTQKLKVHHIKRWADAPALRYVVSNGITLCRSCHDRIKGYEDRWAVLFRKIVIENSK